ncbi:MAG: Ig-like domain-containing protein, partial [Anaerolineales bacterium]|nr:Ig-like domain-containing protein [Anaerolineales bacterium]
DTTDFGIIDDNFGDQALFETLAAEANSRGIRLVLDGVFNHSSSDSIYFDRYGRYASEGACESVSSPFRDWYNFSPQTGGPCAGDTTYESWFGFDSLPKLNSANQDVRDYIWAGGEAAIARYWMQWADGWRLDVGGDVDPGLTNDPNNDYWEGFRDAVHTTNPDAYIVGEEWNVATAWTLGQEWDATMNYQFGSAIMSFWRDSDFVDNDHNAGSSAGILSPLTPSELDARLHNLEERYPPEAFQAMMNLLGSHDTNRALFMLDENTGLQDDTLYDNPNYDWSDAMTRLRGVVLLQMTMPGAPTIYYGDEVGLVGPVTWDGSTWQDDPYNRLPYPWLDETGMPFYTHLQAQSSQDDLFGYYQTLTTARNNSDALRVGSFDTLLVDDGANVYAYGRLLPDYSDAAVVVVNRATAAQAVTVNVSGYLPSGATFSDELNGGSYTVDASGNIVLSSVPGMSGAVLVLDGALAAPPAAVSDLMVTAVSSSNVDLSWSAAAGATSYDVYRSLVSGGGYALVSNVAGTSFSDTGLTVATNYYYVVVGSDDATGLVAGNSNEAAATTAYSIGWANLQWPSAITHTISAQTGTDTVYGRIWIDGITSQLGATPGLLAEVGFGPVGSVPDDSWNWSAMSFNVDVESNDEYMGSMLPDMLGTFCYTTRYSGDGGASWFYAVNGPDEGNATCPGPFGVLTVIAGADTTAPEAPTNLAIAGTTSGSISLAWDAHPNTDGDLFGFELYRDGTRIATIANPAATSYTDTSVTTGATYSYYLVAFDTSYNRSAASNTIEATAEARTVSVTFLVGVPDYTPGTVYIVGDLGAFGPWNPGLVPMTQVDATTWSYTLDILDGTAVQYKFTRGTWETVEAWGEIIGLTNRAMTVSYGSDGTQLVDLTATDWGTGPDDTKAVQLWRDPIVTAVSPADGAVGVPVDTNVSLSWSLPMDAGTSFELSGPSGIISGTFVLTDTNQTVIFTPDMPLAQATTYTVSASGQVSNGNVQQVPVSYSFTTYAPTIEEQFDALTAKLQMLTDAGEFPGRLGQILVNRSVRAKLLYSYGFDNPAILNLAVIVNVTNAMENAGFLTPEDAAEVRDLATGLITELLNN